MCGILCLTSVTVYGSETDLAFSAAEAAEFTSEAAQEPVTGEQDSASPVLTEENSSNGTAPAGGGVSGDAQGESISGGNGQADFQDEDIQDAEEQGTDAPDGGMIDSGVTDADAGNDGNADGQKEAGTDAAVESVTEPVFSSGEEEGQAVGAATQSEIWKWDAISGTFSCYDKTGTQISISELVSKYTAAGNYYGYFRISGRYYCLDDTGKPRTGTVKLTANGVSASYYFRPEANSAGIPGEMYTGWRKINGKFGERWLYYDTGSSQEALGRLWIHKNVVTKLDTAVKGDSYYLLNSGGYIMKKAMRKAENGAYYLSDAKGVIYRNKLVTYKGNQYYVGSSGKRASWQNSWHRLKYANNRLYYFGNTPGKVEKKTGWQQVFVKGKFKGWYYFNKKGVHFADRLLQNGLYFTSIGRLASGLTVMNGKLYFFAPSTSAERNGKMAKNELVFYKNKRYYAGADGRLKKYGWQQVGNDYYYFKNYTAVRNTFITRNGVNGYLDDTGRFTTGWVVVDSAKNKVKYIDTLTKGFAKNTSRVIGGLTYYFDSEGYRINDVSDRVSGPYSLIVDCTNGVMTVYNYNRTIPVKSIRVSVGLPSTPTITGTFTLRRAGRWQQLMGNSWGQYASQISGNYLIHSIPAGSPDPHQVPMQYYYALGQPASHGCVRTNVADAKWVYDHCNGSTITIKYGTYQELECFKGPLGRNAIVPMTTPNTDPTDPSV